MVRYTSALLSDLPSRIFSPLCLTPLSLRSIVPFEILIAFYSFEPIRLLSYTLPESILHTTRGLTPFETWESRFG